KGNVYDDVKKRVSDLRGDELRLKEKVRRLKSSGKKYQLSEKKLDELGKKLEELSYYMIKTKGININEILWMDDVDNLRLIYNNSYSVQEKLGIDSTRTYLILLLYKELMDFGQRVDPRHIEIIFSALTNLGELNGLSFN